MKSNSLGVIVLALFCLVLGVALFYRHKKAEEMSTTQEGRIVVLSNNLQTAAQQIEERNQRNEELDQAVKALVGDRQALSNRLVTTTADLERSRETAKVTSEALTTANQQLRVANDELERRKNQIESLAAERDDLTRNVANLTKNIATLTNSLSALERQIADTQRQLASSEGDRSVLLKELKRLQSEKGDLERRLSDLATLREQITKLKDEMAVNRRLEFMRAGLAPVTGKGGASRLMTPSVPVPLAAAAHSSTNYDLNVDVRSGGGARVQGKGPTNWVETPPDNVPRPK